MITYADPAGQHADVQDTVKSLEHLVLQTILDGRPMEGITCPELLECMLKLLDTTLDGRPMEGITCPELLECMLKLLDTTLDGRPMEGITCPELLECMLKLLDTTLDGGPMEGITCPELLECMLKLLDTTLDGGLVEKISDWEPVAHPVPDPTLDGRLMEGTTNPEHSVLVGSLDSGIREGLSGTIGAMIGRTTYGRNHGNRPAGVLGSGIAIGLWTIEFGIAGAADVEYHSG